jgi:hypothetical protein
VVWEEEGAEGDNLQLEPSRGVMEKGSVGTAWGKASRFEGPRRDQVEGQGEGVCVWVKVECRGW